MGTITDLNKYKRSKITKEELSRGRTPLFVSHQTGKISSSKNSNQSLPKENFGDRVQRIRDSLEKINRLMYELKQLSEIENKK